MSFTLSVSVKGETDGETDGDFKIEVENRGDASCRSLLGKRDLGERDLGELDVAER